MSTSTVLAPAAFDPNNPTGQVTGLVDQIGGQVIDTATGVAPVAVPFVLALAAMAWVLRKFGLSGTAGLGDGLGTMHAPSGAYDAHNSWADKASVDDYWKRYDSDVEFQHNQKIARRRRHDEDHAWDEDY